MAAIGREGGEARGRARARQALAANGHAERFQDRERSMPISRELTPADRRFDRGVSTGLHREEAHV
jgi:hypothetical protein